MTIENQLKQLILDKYGSVRAFTQAINIPYSTIDSMLKRGLGGTSVSIVLLVCLALNLDIEGLLNDELVFKTPKPQTPMLAMSAELQHLSDALDQLNEEGREKLLDYAVDLVASGRHAKEQFSVFGQKNTAAARSGDRMEAVSASAEEEEAALPAPSDRSDI